MAEISQSMLKSSTDEEKNVFSARVLNFINPKFDPENEELETELAEAELYAFATNCELTANEFLLALEMATEGKLSSEPDEQGNSQKIKLFREIDRLKLGEVKSAYIFHKTHDKKYETGKAEIKAFLNPPEKELTAEEKTKIRLEWLEEEYRRLREDGKIFGSTSFFDIITANEEIKMKVQDVANALAKYVPEVAIGKIGEGLPLVKKNDVVTYWKDGIVARYIKKHNLKDLSLNDWINYWEKFAK